MRFKVISALVPTALALAVHTLCGVTARNCLAQATANADDMAAATAIESALVDVIARAEKSVVAISRFAATDRTTMLEDLQRDALVLDLGNQITRQPLPQATGTGVIIDPAGLILTQYVLVDPDRRHSVTTVDGKTYPATIRASDPRSGLAVLKVEASGLPAIKLGDADQLHKGQFVVAIGNPHAIVSDGQPTASWGIVSNLARKLGSGVNVGDPEVFQESLHHFGTLIQTDAKLTFGTGGGALVNLRGEMIGLTTSAAVIAGHEQPAGYAIPINSIFRRIIDVLKQGREVEYGLLGIQFQRTPPTTTSEGTSGVLVSGVPALGPAARAGLQPGDVVTHVGGQPVPDAERLQLIVGTMPPETATTVSYYRAGQTHSANVVLAKFQTLGQKVITNPTPAWRGIRVDFVLAVDPTELGPDAVASSPDPRGCVIVREVEADSSAWRAGIRPGMYISHVGERRVNTPGEFRAAVAADNGVVGIRLTEPVGGGQPNVPVEEREVRVAL